MKTHALSLLVFGLCLCVSGCVSPAGTAINIASSTVQAAPTLAKSAEDFSPEQEYYLGRGVAATLLGQYRPLRAPAADDYLNLLGQSLAKYSTMPNTYGGYHFLLLESSEVNAFAAPGGLILVTRGLVQCTNNEDELAAVLAHEIAHVQLRHGVGSIKQARKTEALMTLGSIAASTAPSPVSLSSLNSLFGGAISDMVQTMAVNGYSRGAELEADQAALAILRGAGYSEAALASMLRNMSARLTPGAGFGKTHPSPADRLKALGVSGSVPANPVRQERFQAALANVR
ncbi:MAG: M48 family metalloprotease [Deltaproteobacteria bacterium]|nr:M48 family metalloprotease [Deltaproteobacteria bacterium]